ncbi:MAG TPA: cell division protein ZapA, partial [Thermoanaerobaculia bacterium]|nr:cell division protein ZapA [Thermoanaerobaculia bacterium]
DGSGHVQALADLVDGKMREIAEQVRTQDMARIAILAALNLADELSKLQRQQEGERVEIRERVVELVEELSAALSGDLAPVPSEI